MPDKEIISMGETKSSEESYLEVLQDIHSISTELESLYKQYTRRLKGLSEELLEEKTKHHLYQLEISDNHQTIQTLSNHIDHLQRDRQKRIEIIFQLNKKLTNRQSKSQWEKNNRMKKSTVINKESQQLFDTHATPTPIPEIMIFYESNHQEKMLLFEQYKKDFISFLLQFQRFILSSVNVYSDIEAYYRLIEKELEEIKMYKKELRKKKKSERWLNIMWNFLWGKSEENQTPEIMKKLESIEEHLQSYASKFKEVSESMRETEEREKKTQGYLEKMSTLHSELKKIEEYYEEELNALKTKLNEYKQKEADLQQEISLLNRNNSKKQSEREEQLESELEKLRQQIQTQSNKKNDLYQKMKNSERSENKHEQSVSASNPEYEKYGKMPMPIESKKTMFDPRRYSR